MKSIFLDDFYGCRPNKSALNAIEMSRSRCFKMKWVLMMFESAHTNARQKNESAEFGYATGRCYQPYVGKSFYALCVCQLDGKEIPQMSVGKICR